MEYIHIGVLLGFIQDILIEAVLSHPRLKLEQKIAIVKALGKVLWIQNDLFAKWYVRDGDEFQEQMPEVEIEGEGILHGKKIIAENELGEDKGNYEGGCPFSGVVRGIEDLGIKDYKNRKENGRTDYPVNGDDVSGPAEGDSGSQGL